MCADMRLHVFQLLQSPDYKHMTTVVLIFQQCDRYSTGGTLSRQGWTSLLHHVLNMFRNESRV
jgi:hypothetical protein